METDPEEARRATRSHCVRDGVAASVMSGIGDVYVVPFAVALGATSAQVGFLGSFTGLFAALSQIVGAELVYWHPRKPLAVAAGRSHVVLWGLLWLLAFLAAMGRMPAAVLAFIAAYSLAAVLGSLGAPAWFSMIGDLVDESERGAFFSRRNRLCGFAAMTATLAGALILDRFRRGGAELAGFAVLFGIAFASRAVSIHHLSRYEDPPTRHSREGYFSFWQFAREAPARNFGRFAIFVGLINFATHFAAPFFAVHMLRTLGYSYLTFSAVSLSAGIYSFIGMKWCGRFGDRYGNRALLMLGSALIPLPPFFWLVSGDPLFLVLTSQLFAGLGWAAFNLAASNFILDAVTPARRAICSAYYTMISGIGIFAGAGLGGLFAHYAPIHLADPILTMFAISGAARLALAAAFLPVIREVRPAAPLALRSEMANLLFMLSPRPLIGTIRGMRIPMYGRLWTRFHHPPPKGE
jgi:MFS family permease